MRHTRKAFTLIELLLGLSIFSLVALSLYGAFSSGIQIEKRSEKGNRLFREISWSLDLIARDLESSLAYNFENSYPDKTAFVGQKDSITFLIPSPEGIKQIRYYLQSPQTHSVYKVIIGRRYTKNVATTVLQETRVPRFLLMREEIPFMESLGGVPAEPAQADVLTPHVVKDGLSFLYAYREGDEEGSAIVWKESWPFKYLPFMVRMRITLGSPTDPNETLLINKDIVIPTGFFGREDL